MNNREFEKAAELMDSGAEIYPCYAIMQVRKGISGFSFTDPVLKAWYNLFQPTWTDIGWPLRIVNGQEINPSVGGHWGDHLGQDGCVLALLFAQAMVDEGDLTDGTL